MTLTQEQKKHLLKLTALKKEEGLALDSILEYFEILGRVDTTHVKSSSRSGRKQLSLRADRVIPSSTHSDALLACSPERIAAHQIVLSGILHTDA